MQQCHHAVQFYESDEFLYGTVADFVVDGLRAADPVVLIMTQEHRAALIERLESIGIDVVASRRMGDLTFGDARELLSRFMDGAMPDPQRFEEYIGGILDDVRRRHASGTIRAFGEMVDVLWRAELRDAAIRLEELWNDLAQKQEFSLLCAYAMGNFYNEAHSAQFDAICARHTSVAPAESWPRAGTEQERARAITVLQQRATVLQRELEQRKRLEKALRAALAERRRTEAVLREAKEAAERADLAKSEFLAVISHELRTPLSAIIGYGDLLDREIAGPLTPEQKLYLTRVSTSAQQLLTLIDQVLSITRMESGTEHVRSEATDIGDVLTEVVAMMQPAAAEKGLALQLQIPVEPVIVETDASKLRQILLNLLANAAKFTEQGGAEVTLQVEAECVLLSVRDTGPGIPPADHERIFERFVQLDGSATRRHGGTGLGLAVSRELARLLGGDLTVDSEPGAGAMFTVTLPVGAKTPANEEPLVLR